MNAQKFRLREILGATLADPDKYVIIGMRHGEKEAGSGDVSLTDHGRKQAGAMLRYLNKEGFCPDIIAYSVAVRTWQMSVLAASLWHYDITKIVGEMRFHFAALAEQLFPGNPRAVLEEAAQIKEAGGTVAKAMEMSVFAGLAGAQVMEGILTLATAFRGVGGLRCGIFFSHSPLLECAAVDEEHTPYCLGECDAILWVVKWDGKLRQNKLISSHYIKAVMPYVINV